MKVKTSLWDWILSNAEGGSGAGGGGGAGDGGEGGDGGQGSGEGGGDGGEGGDQNGSQESGEGGSAAYRPDGLPDNLYGTSNEETIDKMAQALKGYRQKDSEKGVPENEAAYADFGDSVPAELKDHIGSLAEDTAFQRLSKAALERGMSVKDFQGLTVEMFSVAQEMGALEPFIDVKAEQAALVPEEARSLPEAEQKVAREKRMNDNYAFLDTLTAKNGSENGMPAEVAEHAKAMLGDSAKGHQFFEFMRSQISGGSSPYAGGDQGNKGDDAKADLARREALPQNQPGNAAFNKQSWEELQADYKKVFPD